LLSVATGVLGAVPAAATGCVAHAYTHRQAQARTGMHTHTHTHTHTHGQTSIGLARGVVIGSGGLFAHTTHRHTPHTTHRHTHTHTRRRTFVENH
jgi:hypothetical protein